MRLVCKERVVECREDRQIIAGQLDAELAANKIPIKKSDPSSMPARSCRDVLSPAGFRNTTKRDDAKRGDDLDRERKEKRERESDSKREKERCATDRPFCTFFFMQELMEIFLKRFLETTTKRSPSKISLSREKKDVHQPLKTTTEEEEERTIERTMLATDVNGKAPFERLREFQRLAIARSLAYRGLYLKKLG